MALMKDSLFKLGYFAPILLFILFSGMKVSGKEYDYQYDFFCNFQRGGCNAEYVFAIF
ncbi:hypothetical protein CLV51_101787 [Chitinophaga niastensis]|uniref:Uncharacterized protein n=1 Tax=Chitinophaga niastensis TaxID=536980 RepID=A0A2P8HTE2_CHINA|nr:hypothetical protein CLV51_101787 [Chitinophaga niastensis]